MNKVVKLGTDNAIGQLKNADYRPDIDGLRAVSVLAVVGFHAFPNFIPGGFVGVDVFFVISGFLITGILLREADAGTYSIAAFYERRIRRILPALSIVLACSAAACWYILLHNEFRDFGKQLAGAAVFASNLVLWDDAGYFDAAAATKPLLHLWSLAIEEQFYVVFPLIVALLHRHRHGWRAIALIALASLAANLATVGTDPTQAFYSPLTRMWELLVGALLAHAQHATIDPGSAARVHRIARSLAAWAGCALIGVAILGFDKTLNFPGWRAIVPTFGAVLLIAAGPHAMFNRWVLSAWPLVGIGLISYPLYLWHWPILTLHLTARGELVTAPGRLLLVVLSIVLAWLTYRWIEQPVRRRSSPGLSAALLGAMLVMGAIGGVAWSQDLRPRLQATNLDPIVGATTDWQFPPPSFRVILFEGHRFVERQGGRPGTTLFIGDSNVQQYAPRISSLLSADKERYRSVVFATKGGCLPVPDYREAALGCPEYLASALRLAQRTDVDRVVIGGYWLNIPAGPAREEAVQTVGRLISTLSKTRRVYLLMNIAAGPEFDPRNMFTGSRLTTLEPRSSPASLDLEAFLGEYGAMRDSLRASAIDNGGIAIDPLPWLCRDGRCQVTATDGRPLYMDEHHMRPFHAATIASFLDATILDDGTNDEPPSGQ